MRKITILAVLAIALTVMAAAKGEMTVLGTPYIECSDEGEVNYCDFSVTLKNTNAVQAESEEGLIELQVKDLHSGLAWWSPAEKTCDTTTPWNVHKEYAFGGGEELTIALHSEGFSDGSKIVQVVHVDQCCTYGRDCVEKQPFGWGEELLRKDFKMASPPIACNWDADCASQVDANCVSYKCENARTPNSECVCLEKEAGLDDNFVVIGTTLLGAGIGALGFIGGPVVGIPALVIGAGIGYAVGSYLVGVVL